MDQTPPFPDAAQRKAAILLAGGGHAHLGVIADWIKRGPPADDCVLVSRHPKTLYSGMIPGWISGDLSIDEAAIALRPLAEKAGAGFIQANLQTVDPVRKVVSLDNGPELHFGLLSLGTGGASSAATLDGSALAGALDIRPMEQFVERYARWRVEHAAQNGLTIAVIGGGAGGTELAFALRSGHGLARQPRVVFITGENGLLPGFAAGVRRRVQNALDARGIETIIADARFEGDILQADDQNIPQPDLIVTALGSGAPDWPRNAGIQTDERGFAEVDAQHRSLSHQCIFAAGDIAQRADRHLPHSGVHAVYAGPVLAGNLRAALDGSDHLREYTPRKRTLYLLSTGDQSAILTYGRWHAEGVWVWRLKRWIDRRWIKRFRKLAEGV